MLQRAQDRGHKTAGQARHGLDTQLKSQGDALLDTVVLRVNAKHKASVHDPRRVVQGTLTAALTWGLFGLVAGGLKSLAIWAILGAVCGGLWAFYTEHLLRKDELARIGARLPASSSALLTFAETTDPRSVLKAAAAHAPVTASAAGIGDDLAVHVFAGATDPIEVPSRPEGAAITPIQAAPTSMILLRYPDPRTAEQVASRAAPAAKNTGAPVQVELVIQADRDGRRHVADPSQGVKAWAKSDLISWGLFGVAVGALAGAFGGGGVHDLVDKRGRDRHRLGGVRPGGRCAVRPVGGPSRLRPSAQGPARPARPGLLDAGCLGRRARAPGHHGHPHWAGVTAAHPAFHPGRRWRGPRGRVRIHTLIRPRVFDSP